MKRYIQIFTGGPEGRGVTCAELEERLRIFKEDRPDGIIVGWSLDREGYRWLRDYTERQGIELYLWFQAFSEFNSLKEFSPVRDLKGGLLRELLFDKDEKFSFYCPGRIHTTDCLKQIYEEYFEGLGFDGVLLDKIRFPSPAYDSRALFACCCEACLQKYKSWGIDREELERLERAVEQNRKEEDFLGIRTYSGGTYTFREKGLSAYLEARTGLISEAVEELAGYFRGKGLKVGLDLFAPFLALFVGQDYRRLSRCADFVKPMLYRFTDTPAGMAYELSGAVRALSEEGMRENRLRAFRELIGMKEGGLSGFMAEELQRAAELSACPVYAGMEIHTLPGLPGVGTEQIREGVRLLEERGCGGRIASWNLLAADDENTKAFMSAFPKCGARAGSEYGICQVADDEHKFHKRGICADPEMR